MHFCFSLKGSNASKYEICKKYIIHFFFFHNGLGKKMSCFVMGKIERRKGHSSAWPAAWCSRRWPDTCSCSGWHAETLQTLLQTSPADWTSHSPPPSLQELQLNLFTYLFIYYLFISVSRSRKVIPESDGLVFINTLYILITLLTRNQMQQCKVFNDV